MDCIQYICFRYSEKFLLVINCIFVSDILKMASVLLLHSVFANKDFKRIFVTLLVELPVYVLSIIVTFFSIPILLCNVHQCDPLLLTPCCGLAISSNLVLRLYKTAVFTGIRPTESSILPLLFSVCQNFQF